MFKVNTVVGCCDKCGRQELVSDIGASNTVVSTHVKLCNTCRSWFLSQVDMQFASSAESTYMKC